MRKLATAAIVTAMAIGLAFGLVACSGSSSTTSTAASSGVASSSAAVTASSTASQDAALSERNGFDEATNTVVEIQGVNFSVPSYFVESSSNSSSDKVVGYSAKTDDGSTDLMYMMFYMPDGTAASVDKFESNKDDAILPFLENNKMLKNVKIDSREAGTVGNLPSGIYTLSGEYTGDQADSFSGKGAIFLNSSMHYAAVYLIQFDGASYDYSSDFDKMLASATEIEPATSASADGVSADLKEMLDSYEAFMDEYIAFMQKYKNASSADLANMMADYAAYMQKYSELTQKINALDSSTMSNADAAYYIEVTSRVSQKLLNAAV